MRAPRLESLFVAALVLFGFRLGARPITDNSMFTHVRTGIRIVNGLGIPRVDPYSFTAFGHRWIVQSWLPEWTYGWAYRLGGGRLVVLEQAVLCAVLALLVVRLARAGSPLRTAAAGAVALGAGAPYWSPRPLLFGLACMALMVTVVERRRSPWLLIPIVWLWVQSHGSFPLGLAWLGARAAGEWLDWKAWPDETGRYLGGFVAGLAASVVNPLGAALLAFPVTVGAKKSAFTSILEWKSPDFQASAGRFSLLFIAIALAILVRSRVTWRDMVPVVAFLVIGLLALRNLPVLAIVLAPALGRALRRPEGARVRTVPDRGRLADRQRINRGMAVVILLAFVLFTASIFTTAPFYYTGYPVKAVTFLDDHRLLDPPHHVAEQDFVGNYLELRLGRRRLVFIDDRYDMYPVEVSRDYRLLLGGKPEVFEVLDHYKVDVVVWRRDLPLATILQATGRWRELYGDRHWVVYQRDL